MRSIAIVCAASDALTASLSSQLSLHLNQYLPVEVLLQPFTWQFAAAVLEGVNLAASRILFPTNWETSGAAGQASASMYCHSQ